MTARAPSSFRWPAYWYWLAPKLMVTGLAAAVLLLAGSLATQAQQAARVYRVGFVTSLSASPEPSPRAAVPTHAWTWAALMPRGFDLDVLAGPHCGGRLRVIATVQDPLAVQAILAHLARPGAPAPPGPAPPASAAIG